MKATRLVLAALAIMAICGYAGDARAATGLTIQPVKVSYTIEPGKSVSDTIILKNPGGDAEIFQSVQDFIPLAGSSNIQFVGRTDGVTSVVDWIKVHSSANFSFKAGEDRQIGFTITVPKDAQPGSHFGVIFFRASDAAASTSQLKIGTQVGMLVLVTVPGSHLQKGRINGFTTDGFIQKGPVQFKIAFENTGTVYFEPKGEIVVTNIFGKTVAKVPVAGSIVLPTGIRDIDTTWPVGFLMGPYTAAVTLYDGEGTELTADSVKFFALPVWYALGVIVLLIIVYAIIVFFKNRVSFSVKLKKR